MAGGRFVARGSIVAGGRFVAGRSGVTGSVAVATGNIIFVLPATRSILIDHGQESADETKY